jgi:sugar/nucleoside kinase (ribokinase family)
VTCSRPIHWSRPEAVSTCWPRRDARGCPRLISGGTGKGDSAISCGRSSRRWGSQFCIGLVDDSGERTYATRQGVEGNLQRAELEAFVPAPSDAIYLSGYELGYQHGKTLASWFAELDASILTVFDPGPLAGELPRELLDSVVARADWVSMNRDEARALTGAESAEEASVVWRRSGRGPVVIRDGGRGCWLVGPDGVEHVPVPNPHAAPLDTSGAGDTHVGTFLAALARGESAQSAAYWANAAAALSVMRKGPASSPTHAEVAEAISARAD